MPDSDGMNAFRPDEPAPSRLMRKVSIALAATAMLLLVAGLAFVGQPHYAREAQLGTLAVLWISAAAIWIGAGRAMRSGMLKAGILGWGAEAVGVHTGLPFGQYRYNAVMGPAVLEAPLAMVPAWSVLTAFAVSVVPLVNPYVRSLAVAACLVLVDMVLDPVACSVLGLWTWTTGGAYFGVPISNFAGWFVVGWVCALGYRQSAHSEAAAWVGWALVMFYTVIAAWHGLTVPAAIGVGVAVISAILWYRRRRS